MHTGLSQETYKNTHGKSKNLHVSDAHWSFTGDLQIPTLKTLKKNPKKKKKTKLRTKLDTKETVKRNCFYKTAEARTRSFT